MPRYGHLFPLQLSKLESLIRKKKRKLEITLNNPIYTTKMNTNKLTQFAGVVGTFSQIIIAGSVLCDLYLRFRTKKTAPVNIPDDDGDIDPSPATPLTNAA